MSLNCTFNITVPTNKGLETVVYDGTTLTVTCVCATTCSVPPNTDNTEYFVEGTAVKRILKLKHLDGSDRWYHNDNLHRISGPAITHASGTKEWYQHGARHRVDGPAVEYCGGDNYWYHDDKIHRVDGPAIVRGDGTEEWYQHGKCHRVDGPACKFANGTEEWYLEGKLHRVGGPAVTGYLNGKLSRVAVYEHGVMITEIKC